MSSLRDFHALYMIFMCEFLIPEIGSRLWPSANFRSLQTIMDVVRSTAFFARSRRNLAGSRRNSNEVRIRGVVLRFLWAGPLGQGGLLGSFLASRRGGKGEGCGLVRVISGITGDLGRWGLLGFL